ncbi:glucan biosynthesis protein G [Catenovulum sp. 2E275]|uniref:glucan biosynthesis protein n=1 Tax=Catenovulum sp. 2E275 TaxID=2980497 RepID=UPI0021CE7122|nr:glucan biosynthesis protein G [Catenovulum sp. 2E275]MCU4674703.1 glucan biosynthesis protein G [Catenovulum sp. 2E275]
MFNHVIKKITPVHLRKQLFSVACLSGLVFTNTSYANTENFQAKTPESILFDMVSARAKALAEKPYQEAKPIELQALTDIDYQAYRAIRFKAENALWRNQSLFEVQFFHPGFLYKQPVTIETVNEQGDATKIPFSPDAYRYEQTAAPLEKLIKEQLGATQLGHAGFRVHFPLNTQEYKDEVAVFQGASYFRLVGPNQIYGLSARGLAIDTAAASGEEFPTFKQFWLVKPKENQSNLVIYALLDSPSVAGAYRFNLQAAATTKLKVEARLFARQDIQKLGIAPLTSMFHHGENTNRFVDDFRPEVHDSDGLLMQASDGQWTWRPLTNPKELRVTSFVYTNPKGFGLLQRDRDFNHYLDAEAHYGKRPSIWIEPDNDWGDGRIELVEIPTNTETNDNIVSYWVSDQKLKAGQTRNFSYTLSTFDSSLMQHQQAQAIRTRNGWAALPGENNPPPKSKRQFIVDFKGGDLENLSEKLPLNADLALSGGSFEDLTVTKLPENQGWRVSFKISPKDKPVIDMRLSLKLRDQQISEVWNYVWYTNDAS